MSEKSSRHIRWRNPERITTGNRRICIYCQCKLPAGRNRICSTDCAVAHDPFMRDQLNSIAPTVQHPTIEIEANQI